MSSAAAANDGTRATATAAAALVLGGLLYAAASARRPHRSQTAAAPAHAGACGAIDPVSDPAYNMKEIAKQSILLEEHIAERNKRCRDCICKHFLHIIGLAEEAQCLAGSGRERYPILQDTPEFYRAAFEEWLAVRKQDGDSWLPIQDRLRERRKRLVHAYFLQEVEGGGVAAEK